MKTVLEVNKALMDILSIPTDQRHNISSISIEITPIAYPAITIEQVMVVDKNLYTSDVEFELIGKE